ncbi:MAG TPA: SDR family NAD(P)-dependent oxidoreductase [Pseudonocardiaceae bacterium]
MPEPLFASRTVLVTGATDGIGYETARDLVFAGATVILHARNREYGEDTIARLVKLGAEPLRLHLLVADFTRLREVTELAEQVSDAVPTLDVLVNNAAVAGPRQRTLTEDGNELTFQVNYLAPYLLTRALSGMIATARGRVVNVSSALHRGGRVDWADPTRARNYTPLAVYAQSKLALTMFTRGLAEFSPRALTAVSVHPGVFDTALLPMYGRIGRPACEAAPHIVRLCAPKTAVVNGGYYEQDEAVAPAELVDNPRARARLSRLSGQLADITA